LYFLTGGHLQQVHRLNWQMTGSLCQRQWVWVMAVPQVLITRRTLWWFFSRFYTRRSNDQWEFLWLMGEA